MSTTPTPRTDKFWQKHLAWCNADEAMEAICDFRDLARTLETELAALRAEIERWRDSNNRLRAEMEQQALRANTAEAEAERLKAACDKYSNDEIAQGDWKARAERAESERAEARRHLDAMRAECDKWKVCAERLGRIVAADESDYTIAADIEPALAELSKLKGGVK